MLPSTIIILVLAVILATIIAADQAVLYTDQMGRQTNGYYYISNRKYKQSEAFLECSDSENLRLVEIESEEKRVAVSSFLLNAGHITGWTSGEAVDFELDEYRWRWSDSLVGVECNWYTQPDRSDENIWLESGIVLNASVAKWVLKHATTLHPAICEEVPDETPTESSI